MGLEASVMCTCYADGKTRPFPLDGTFFINEQGFPDLMAKNLGEDERRIFYHWLRTACEHPGMIQGAVYISSWPDYAALLLAFEAVGWDDFPQLDSEMPSQEPSVTPAAAVPAMREELARFRALPTVGEKIFVIDAETGDRMYARIPEHGNTFIWDGESGLNIGVDHDGIFFTDAWDGDKVLFRSHHLEQELLEPELTDQRLPGRVLYTDIETGRTFECKTPIPGGEIPWPDGRMRDDEERFRLHYPRQVAMQIQPVTPEYFAPLLDQIDAILQISEATGNPVRWH
jgi:hypothetical protein